jgi:hypothetical protein
MTYETPNPAGPSPQWPTPPGTVPPPRKPHRWRNRLLITGGGVVGLIVVLIVVGLTTGTKPKSAPPRPTGLVHLRFGQKAVLSSAWASDGIVSATVYSLRMPFTSQTLNRPDAGQKYALGSVGVCAGPQGANTSSMLLPYPFSLVYPGNQTFGALAAPDAAKEPDLGNTPSTLAANRCVRAYVTFEYTPRTKPLAVAWGNPDQPAYEWAITGS